MSEGETREIVIIESQVWTVMEREGGDKSAPASVPRLEIAAALSHCKPVMKRAEWERGENGSLG